jgi:hypothetical protein
MISHGYKNVLRELKKKVGGLSHLKLFDILLFRGAKARILHKALFEVVRDCLCSEFSWVRFV